MATSAARLGGSASLSQPVLTAHEIAEIAAVQRPVVTVWRRRPIVHGQSVPFPAPVVVAGDVQYFDASEVATWMHRTGRGNNPDFAVDAAAAATPAGSDLASLTTLLCLRVLAGRPLSGQEEDELVDLADGVDPDDAMLLREVEAMGGLAPRLAPYVDGLHEASFGPADALERLHATRLGRSIARPLAPAGVGLLAGVVDAVVEALAEGAGVADAAGDTSALALDVARRGRSERPVLLDESGDRARLQRCTAALLGVPVAAGGGGKPPAVSVLSVIGMDPGAAIDAVDDLQLLVSDRHSAVVIGAASLLCDRLDDQEVERVRSTILRSDHLRLAARLPRGLRPDGPRQMLALWVFAPGRATRIEERTMVLLDLSDSIRSTAVADDLATDVAAALTDGRRRSFAFGRLARTSAVIATGEVVPQGVVPQRFARVAPGERMVRIEELGARLRVVPHAEDVAARLDPRQGAAPGAATLGELVTTGRLVVVSGSRLDLDLATRDGTVRLADPGGAGDPGFAPLAFDPVVLAEHHDHPARTEPGDVVFTVTPRPSAVVDAGGAVVATPARILRPSADFEISPQLLAAEMNRRADGDREWRGWRVPLLDDPRHLDDALADLASERAATRERLHLLDTLVGEVLDGTADGTITVTPPEGA